MASTRAKLHADQRTDFGSRSARRLRRSGNVPGVVYGDGGEARPFQVDSRELFVFLNEGHSLFDLEVGSAKPVPVVVKEQQRHPVRGELIHIDLHEVKLDQAIHADVPIELEGSEDAPGVKDGGVLEHVTSEITIEALPAEIPERITVDVSQMEIGDVVTLETAVVPEGVKLVADEPSEWTVATLSPPRLEEEIEPELEEEAELVGEEGEEEVPEEGAEPAEEGAEPEAAGDEGGGDEE